MTTPPYENPHRLASAAVVVGVDGSEGADLAVRWAAETAAHRHRDLLLVHGLDLASTRSMVGYYDVLTPSITETIHKQGRRIVDADRRLAQSVNPDLVVAVEISEAGAAELLIRHSRTAHLVVIGATGNAGAFAHIGSTLLAVSAHGHGSVIVVRDTAIRHTGPVVVGVDGTEAADAAIAAAFDEAAERETELVAVHARAATPSATDENGAADTVLAERLAGWQEKYPNVRVRREARPAQPTQLLMDWSDTAQLIVVGTRGRGALTGLLLGSTSNFLVQHAHCPVLIAHRDQSE
ncbi:universal stress protein [Nocardia arthritidis]|uniref:Universal stress protein n=1 Tax=Nocardia arthritidis TaxID=228602 RepID=A0A6G9YH74_9NOCA|nr:universal stress protein [Nocardia arthritidis]QIS12541.1 universal stress protein [Nocardia arthritidis]